MRLLLIGLAVAALRGAEWQSLIHRDSFAGWRSPSGHTPPDGAWTIHHGVLTVKPFVHRRTDLWSTEEYENFELIWEWKAAKGANSGVKYWAQNFFTLVVEIENRKWRQIPDPRSARPEEITLEYSRGLEYQMADDAHEPDSLQRADSRSGGLYGMIAPSHENARPHGEWNKSRLLVDHGRFEHWLNGKRVAAFDLAQLEARLAAKRFALKAKKGPLVLQYHQTEVAFRKMRVRRLAD